jgi:hypothetical protein
MRKKESGASRMGGIACGLVLLALPATLQTAHAQSSWPTAADYANNNFDKRDTVKVTGELAEVETANDVTILWVNATKVEKTGYGTRPGTEAPGKGNSWRVEGPAVAKLKDPASLPRGAKIVVTGDNSDDKTCKPSCRILAEKVSVK